MINYRGVVFASLKSNNLVCSGGRASLYIGSSDLVCMIVGVAIYARLSRGGAMTWNWCTHCV